jgi:hypothetical protein
MSKPEGQRLVIKEKALYETISAEKGRKTLRDTTLKNLNFGKVRVTAVCTSDCFDDQRRAAFVVVCRFMS